MNIERKATRIYDYIVVGAGLTGCTFARIKAEEGYQVLVLDRRPHLGGNVYDELDNYTELMVHKYGPHLFHTNSKKVHDFLSHFTEWRPYEHRVRALIEHGITIPLPVNFDSIAIMGQCDYMAYGHDPAPAQIAALKKHFKHNQRYTLKQLEVRGKDEPVLQELWQRVYDTVFKNYTQKMWGCTLEELGPAVADRVPLIAGDDDRYFADTYQCMPVDGYTEMVRKMVGHRSIDVLLGTDHAPDVWNTALTGGKMVYTGAIDEFFNYRFGKLPYRGISFLEHNIRWSADEEQAEIDDQWRNWKNASTVNSPNAAGFTRVSSMRRISGDPRAAGVDVWVSEKPNDTDRYYPVPKPENRDLYAKYEELAADFPRIKFAGRLGSYQYLNMDQAVAQALKLAEDF